MARLDSRRLRCCIEHPHAPQIFCLFGAGKDTDLSYTYDVEAFTTDTPSSPSKVRAVLSQSKLWVSLLVVNICTVIKGGYCFDGVGSILILGKCGASHASVTLQTELGPGDGTVNKRSLEACMQLGPRVRTRCGHDPAYISFHSSPVLPTRTFARHSPSY